MTRLDEPDNRRRFARHAAIEAELDQAYAAERAAQKRIKFLTELLIQRATELRERAL